MIQAICLSIAFVILSAIIDAEHIKKEQFFSDHKSRWILRFIFFLAIGIDHIEYIIGSALIFTALFDQVLNRLRGLGFWYLGTEAKWDLFFSSKPILYKFVKISALIGGVVAFFSKLFFLIVK